MKKFILPLLFTFSSLVIADAPKLPDLNNWDKLTEREKAQAGAFFLFYDLAKNKMIGPGTGVCMNYEPGTEGAGSMDKISIALDSAQFEMAQANGMALGNNSEKIKAIFGKLKNYLDSGCSTPDCKSQRKVTVAGYADATRNRIPADYQVEPIAPGSAVKYSDVLSRQSKSFSNNPTNPSIEDSIKANTNLATRRAALYADLAKDFTDDIYVTAHPSPIGEYLRDNKPVPASLGGEGLKPGDLAVDCQSRRRAVIDVEFNPHKIDLNTEADTLGLNISAGSKDLLYLSSIDASLQILKQSLALKSKDEDKIIDAALEAQGITDPDIKRGCKNEASKAFVRESLKRTKNSELKQLVSSSADNNSILADFKDAVKSKKELSGANANLKELYDELNKEGIAAYVRDDKLIKGNGYSSSIIDCFSAKAALKTELQKNTSLRNQVCKSAKEFTKNNQLKVSYDPGEAHHGGVHHIGCTGCGTGYNIAKNPKTGKYEGFILDRFYGNDIPANRNVVMKDHKPFSRDEVMEYKTVGASLSTEVQDLITKISQDKNDPKRATKINELRHLKLKFEGNVTTDNKVAFEYMSKYKDQFKDQAGLAKAQEFLERVSYKSLSKDRSYVKKILNPEDNDKDDNKEIEYYENILYPAVTTQKKLSGFGSSESSDPHSKMSFGGMKNPGYYVVPNCRCDDQNASVVDKIANMKPTVLNEFPYKASVPVSDPDNTCIFMPPVPASCSWAPSEGGLTTDNEKGGPAKIKWISGDGQQMEKTALEMASYLGEENKKFGEVAGCNATDPVAKAEQLLAKSTCQGNMALPTTEANDCKKSSASNQ